MSSKQTSPLPPVPRWLQRGDYPLKGIIVVFLFPLIFLLSISCNETREIGPEILGYDYYPIEIGQYRIYDVEEIRYDLIGFDTSVYQLRETLFDSIISGDRTSYLIRRDKRSTLNEPWVSDSVWTVSRTENFLSITENNIPFIKLTFPASVPKEWDGNSLNSRSELTYYYQPINESIIDSISAEAHIRLIIEDIPRNIVNQDERSEVYVRGVGLVEKDYLSLQFCTANCEELGEIQGGRSLKQTLIELGFE